MKNHTITFQVWNLSKNNGMNETYTSPFDTHEEETNNERTDSEKENTKNIRDLVSCKMRQLF